MLTVQILVRNNEKTIKKALDSLPDGVRVVVGNLGCSDSTLAICRDRAEILDLKWERDYSVARNALLGEGLNMYLEPWEFLMDGGELLNSLEKNTSVYVVESGVVSKQIRIWSGERFHNPVFETIVAKSECDPRIVIGSSGAPDLRQERLDICKCWLEKKPTNPEPYYYTSFCLLSLGMVSEFIPTARKYLAMREDSDTSSVMLRYSLARAEFLSGDMSSAVRTVMVCICLRPTFAEFWCLLGDMLYKMGEYSKAEAFYRNAMTIGKRRMNSDDGPMEIKKYRDYPMKMIANMRDIGLNSQIISQTNI